MKSLFSELEYKLYLLELTNNYRNYIMNNFKIVENNIIEEELIENWLYAYFVVDEKIKWRYWNIRYSDNIEVIKLSYYNYKSYYSNRIKLYKKMWFNNNLWIIKEITRKRLRRY